MEPIGFFSLLLKHVRSGRALTFAVWILCFMGVAGIYPDRMNNTVNTLYDALYTGLVVSSALFVWDIGDLLVTRGAKNRRATTEKRDVPQLLRGLTEHELAALWEFVRHGKRTLPFSMEDSALRTLVDRHIIICHSAYIALGMPFRGQFTIYDDVWNYLHELQSNPGQV